MTRLLLRLCGIGESKGEDTLAPVRPPGQETDEHSKVSSSLTTDFFNLVASTTQNPEGKKGKSAKRVVIKLMRLTHLKRSSSLSHSFSPRIQTSPNSLLMRLIGTNKEGESRGMSCWEKRALFQPRLKS